MNNIMTNQQAPADPRDYPSSYREVKIGKTLYQVTSVFTGEKELGPALEKVAARKVLDEMESLAKEALRGA